MMMKEDYTKLRKWLNKGLRVTTGSGDTELQKFIIPKIIVLKEYVEERERVGREVSAVKE